VRAAQAGARTIAVAALPGMPFADRMDLARKLVASLRSFDLAAEVLVGSLRNASDVVDVALAGANVAAAPASVLRALSPRPLAGAGADDRPAAADDRVAS
jgi:hypothetical protein